VFVFILTYIIYIKDYLVIQIAGISNIVLSKLNKYGIQNFARTIHTIIKSQIIIIVKISIAVRFFIIK